MSLATADPCTRPGASLALLAALALGEVLLSLLLAGVFDRLASGSDGVLLPLLAAGGIAAMLGAAFLLLVWMAEDLAQGTGGTPGESRA